MPSLFDPLQVGDITLPNRLVMAPLTRSRAGSSRVPNELMAQYYRQRASAGLIITEATSVTPMGVGYADTPGIWSAEQVSGWTLTTRAVHEAGGRIFLQLWHVGRISHPRFLDGRQPVAPSAIAPEGFVSLVRPQVAYPVPRALAREELPGIIEAYRQGARNARAAGFDGVEIHGANGYLLDQFLQDRSNQRTDEYGGSIANRARLMLEVADAVMAEWGAGRVGMHLSPRGDAHTMGDSDPAALFGHVAAQLGRRGLAFLCVREHTGPDRLGPALKAAFGGVYIANEGFTFESATQALAAGEADAVAFGRLFIANPDLPRRLKLGAPLNEPDIPGFYAGGAKGYTDYPSL
ncbi:MAG TPA: alkene reductase [Steroidobacteraceae bacterium]|nr:alkene reductase [Steroidobacteraceae bacterium]